MTKDLRGMTLNGKIKIPKNWTWKKTQGEGSVYISPDKSQIIRVMKEGLTSGNPNFGKPYVRIQKNKEFLTIEGKTSINEGLTHIIINQIK